VKFSRIPNWDKLRERYLAHWRHEVLDSMIIAHIQNPVVEEERPVPEDWMLNPGKQDYTDPERLYKLSEWRRTAYSHHTDLFRYKICGYGPNIFAGFCGAKVEFGKTTTWHEPVISSIDEADKIHFDPDGEYWKIYVDLYQYFVKKCRGTEHLGIPDFGGPGDWIAACVGTEAMLIECAMKPDAMRDFALRLAEESIQAYEILYGMMSKERDGDCNWLPIWSEKKLTSVQDDIAVNFSPEMYKEIFFPAIKKIAGHGERCSLHWHDGAAQHTDIICELEDVDHIQFGSDPSIPDFKSMLPSMQKIQNAGKCMMISCVKAEDAEFFIRNLDPGGLSMIIDVENDEEAKRMEENVVKWTAERLDSI
jgi:hypothetical protein